MVIALIYASTGEYHGTLRKGSDRMDYRRGPLPPAAHRPPPAVRRPPPSARPHGNNAGNIILISAIFKQAIRMQIAFIFPQIYSVVTAIVMAREEYTQLLFVFVFILVKLSITDRAFLNELNKPIFYCGAFMYWNWCTLINAYLKIIKCIFYCYRS